jgi:hypothetical protein
MLSAMTTLHDPLLVALLSCLIAGPLSAAPEEKEPAGEAPAPPAGRFIRFTEDATRGRLETSVTRYENTDGVAVDFVGAVHLADPTYYKGLNTLFKDYGVVLYEMVGGEQGGDPGGQAEAAPADDPTANLLRGAQMMITNLLKLQHQFAGIDYKAENFVHADLSWKKFRALQEEKGESFASLLQKAMQAELEVKGKDDAKDGDADPSDLSTLMTLLGSLRSGDTSDLKLMMARQFCHAEEVIGAFEGEEGSVIIAERNKVVLAAIAEQMKKGKKKIAVFYGAGHYPDMEKRLIEQGFKRTKHAWRTAWDIPKQKADPGGEDEDEGEGEGAEKKKAA